MKQGVALVIAGLLVALGVAVGGFFVGDGFQAGRSADRYVTVKGLAERIVKADVASWPLRFTASGDDLGAVQAKIEADGAQISDFLDSAGISSDAYRLERLEVVDKRAQLYGNSQVPVGGRFVVTQTLAVRTADVDRIVEASRSIGDLVKAGIVLSDSSGPSYAYTSLNDIKPEMIAEATKSARASAQQFADDSGSSVGAIRQANQGIFSILPRDSGEQWQEAQSIEKRVRVVSTIQYFIED